MSQGFFGSLAFGYIADRRRNQNAALFLQGAQADLDGEAAAILTSSEQVKAGPHGAGMGRSVVRLPVLRMLIAEVFGNQDFYRLIEQVFPAIAEHALSLRVDQHYPPGAIHDDHGVGRRFQQTTKFFIPVAQTLIVFGFWLAHQVGNLALHQLQSKPPATLSFARHRLSFAFAQQQTGRGISSLTRDLIITPMPRQHSRS